MIRHWFKRFCFFAIACSLLNTSYAALNLAAAKDHFARKLQKPVPTLAPLLKKVMPAVVTVHARSGEKSTTITEKDLNQFFFNQPPRRKRPRLGLGSGVVFNKDKGYIVTNEHIVQNAKEIVVILENGKQVPAKLLGSDSGTDLAVLQIPAKNLQAIGFANSSKLQVGDFVLAVGNPFGLSKSVTAGIISGLGRNLGIKGYENYIQTDAPINPGNSGGALIDLHGQLAGINTAILSPAGGNVGIGFAIPSNTVKHIVNQIIQFGNVKRGKLGIIIQNVNDKYAHILKLKQPQGALIVEVEPNSVAKKNGLKQADVIVKVNNKPIKNVTTLRNTIGLERLGNKIKITVIRNGKEKELNLVLTEIKADIVTFGKLFPPLSGATFANLNKSTLSVHSGVVVKSIQPMSYAWRVGLRKGDIINAVNMRKVTNTFNFRQLVRMYSRGDILLHIIRDQSSFYLVLRKVT